MRRMLGMNPTATSNLRRRDSYRCPYQERKVLSTAVHTSFSRRSGLRLEMSSLSQPVVAKSRASA